MLLEKEHGARAALTHEVARLRVGLARQNARIVALQQEMIGGLQEQNALLRDQVAQLQAEKARLAGTVHEPKRPPGNWRE